MPLIGLRDLSRDTRRVIDDVQRTRRPHIVTRNGKPVAVLYAIDVEHLEDFVLANAPEFAADLAEADAEAASGALRPVDDVFAEIDGPE